MTGSASSRLRTVLLLYAIFAVILGLLYLLVPKAWGDLVGWSPAEPFDHRIIGATFLAFGLGAWLARSERSWQGARVFVQMNVLWCTLATLLLIWGLLTGGLPALGWVYVVCVGGFAAAFGASYFGQARA